MKKVVRTVWISVLTGLALLVVSCTSQNRIPRKVKKELMAERDSIEVSISESKEREAVYWGSPYMQDLNNYDNLSMKRENCNTLIEIKKEQVAMYQRLNEINSILGKNEEALENEAFSNKARNDIQRIEDILDHLVPPCVYGPPPTDR